MRPNSCCRGATARIYRAEPAPSFPIPAIQTQRRIHGNVLAEYLPKTRLAAEGDDLAQLEERLDEVIAMFISDLVRLEPEAQQVPVAEGKWNPLEIACHLVLSTDLCASAVQSVLAGDPAVSLPKGLLTTEGTMIAHPVTVPAEVGLLEDLMANLVKSSRALVQQVRASQQADLAESPCFVSPYFGPLTAIECLQLAIVHAAHHCRQLPA